MIDSVRCLEKEMMAHRRRSGPYVFGDRFTLTDVALYPWFEQAGALEQLSELRLPRDCVGLCEWRLAASGRQAVQQCACPLDWYAERYRSYLAA